MWPAPDWVEIVPDTGFVPDPLVLGYYAIFFLLGGAICRHRAALLPEFDRDCRRWAALALAAALPAAILFSLHNSAAPPVVHGAALVTYAIATWAAVFALIGLAGRYMRRARP